MFNTKTTTMKRLAKLFMKIQWTFFALSFVYLTFQLLTILSELL